MRISFGDLRIGDIGRQRLQAALEKNWVSEGENVAEFEREFAALLGFRHAVATSSGTDADIIACAVLHDLGAQRGDEIIVPACAFVAAANSILAAGFVPRFVDIELESLNLAPAKLEAAIGPRTRAIMAVHTMGRPCDMDAIQEVARRHRLRVIEDACEAHGARYRGRMVGAIGDVGAFSFYAAHLICAGEGGMAVTADAEIAGLLRSVRSHGRPPGSLYFDFQRFGTNSKMNDLEAAIGLDGLAVFWQVFDKRRAGIARLMALTDDLSEYVLRLDEAAHEVIAPHAFPLVLRDPRFDRDALYRHLEAGGVQCKTLFGSLPTQHRAFAFLGHRAGEFPVAEYVGRNGVHFGCHQHLSDDDLCFVSELLHQYFHRF